MSEEPSVLFAQDSFQSPKDRAKQLLWGRINQDPTISDEVYNQITTDAVFNSVFMTAIGVITDLLKQADENGHPQLRMGSETYTVLQDWTSTISHRQQGVLLLALRGPDGFPKESGVKNIIRSLRACVMNSGDTKTALALGEALLSKHDTFMTMEYLSDSNVWTTELEHFVRNIDVHNVHFLQHLLHATMVLSFNHPDVTISSRWCECANRIARKLHIKLESRAEFTHRLRDGVRTEREELA